VSAQAGFKRILYETRSVFQQLDGKQRRSRRRGSSRLSKQNCFEIIEVVDKVEVVGKRPLSRPETGPIVGIVAVENDVTKGGPIAETIDTEIDANTGFDAGTIRIGIGHTQGVPAGGVAVVI
jgi:hypothetical protein